jgi:hypothetical protein
VAESYHLNITGEEPASWLLKLAFGPPSLVPSWPGSPHLAMVVAVTLRPEGGVAAYDEVTVPCTREKLRELAVTENDRFKLYFTVDRARLFRACPQIDPADFEECDP